MNCPQPAASKEILRQLPQVATVKGDPADYVNFAAESLRVLGPEPLHGRLHGLPPCHAASSFGGAALRQAIQSALRAVALPALRHRVLLNFEGEAEQVNPDTIVNELLTTVSTEG